MHRKVGSTESANVQGVSIVSHALKRLIQVHTFSSVACTGKQEINKAAYPTLIRKSHGCGEPHEARSITP